MHLKIGPACGLNGNITVPSDKSISHRSIMFASLADGKSTITNFLESEDCLNTMQCFRNMGITIDKLSDNIYSMNGKGLMGLNPPEEVLYCGNSGTTIRLMLGILAGQKFQTIITGDESIKKRPMLRVVGPLREMGALITGREGGKFAPLEIRGASLSGIEHHLKVASAQVKSALMLAGLFAKGITKITEPASSRDHTEKMFEHFGIPFTKANNTISVQQIHGFPAKDITIPSDISSAAFFIVAALITTDSEININNVGINPTRSGIINILQKMGAQITVERTDNGTGEMTANITAKSSKLHGIKISGGMIPNVIDEIPIIAVAASLAEGETVISDAKELRVKESDRIRTTVSELKKLGADIKETDDGMIIKGVKNFSSADCKSHGDHRIAMAVSIAALAADGPVTVDHCECIETSFPGFEKLLGSLTGQDILDQD